MTASCPSPGKRRYATAEAAAQAAARTAPVYGRLLNSYLCRCGWTHLTKLAPAENYRTHNTESEAAA